MDTALITSLLGSAKAPAILWSGGKDSTLLLLAARRAGFNPPVVWFQDGSPSAHIKQMIYDLDLTVWSWAPANLYLLASANSTALISEFSLNGESLPMLTNVRAQSNGRCLAVQPRTPKLFLPFDLLLTGYKDCDTHWAVDGTLLYPEGLIVGGIRLVAPLRHFTDEQVKAELAKLDPAFVEHDDVVAVCADCVAGKPLHWDKPLDLTTFRSRIKL